MLPAPDALILIAVLPQPRDLEIARLLGWYRIPLRRAPRLLMVDFIAFYQTGAFGAHGGRIEFYASVAGHELTTRRELFQQDASHPWAREEYFKISIGALQHLPAPLPAGRWKRFVFFYTTGDYLRTARSIDDLVVRREDRQSVWQALRERALRGGGYQASAWPESPPPDLLEAVFLLLQATERR